ncbi:MAG: hypothetical protein NTY12_00125 [Candidatus Falkowbacteria bacterium]|nr:hypothetical protein [Candidatus Falkowbacteria bacterium]
MTGRVHSDLQKQEGMFLNKNKKLHRNGSIRLANYDYSRNGYYFITICTKNRGDIFGEIVGGKIKFNYLGNIVIEQWREIKKQFPFVELDEFIVMPDHVHGIIIINKKIVDTDAAGKRYNNVLIYHDNVNAHRDSVGACRGMRLQRRNQFGKPKNGSLPMIINHFKGAITKLANKNNIPFLWQPRYYEHVIREQRALDNIRRYIRNNPIMWHN